MTFLLFIKVPLDYVPQTLPMMILFLFAFVLLVFICFPSTAWTFGQIMVWSPWLLASLLVTIYNFCLVMYTLTRILIALCLYLMVCTSCRVLPFTAHTLSGQSPRTSHASHLVSRLKPLHVFRQSFQGGANIGAATTTCCSLILRRMD